MTGAASDRPAGKKSFAIRPILQREEKPIVDRCVNCQFYDRQNKGQGVGQCRRQAPALSPINIKVHMIEGVWPTVRDDDWCGEWKAGGRRSDPRVAEFLNAGMPPMNLPSRTGEMPAGAGLAGTQSPMSSIRGND